MITKFNIFINENVQDEDLITLFKNNSSPKSICDYLLANSIDYDDLFNGISEYKRFDILKYALDKLPFGEDNNDRWFFNIIKQMYNTFGKKSLSLYSGYFEAQAILDDAVKYDDCWNMCLDLYSMSQAELGNRLLTNNEILEYAMGWHNDPDFMGTTHSLINVGKLLDKFGDAPYNKVRPTNDTFRRISETSDEIGINEDEFFDSFFKVIQNYLKSKDDMFILELFERCDLNVVAEYAPKWFYDLHSWIFEIKQYM